MNVDKVLVLYHISLAAQVAGAIRNQESGNVYLSQKTQYYTIT